MSPRSSTWLIDTGPLVAYLDRNDPAHGPVGDRLGAFTGRLVTTGAVVGEAAHFLSSMSRGARLLAELVTDGGVRVFDLCQPAELRSAATLMERYAFVPMDLADATLLLLAEGLGVTDILTLDRRGFSTYRTREGRALRLVLDAV